MAVSNRQEAPGAFVLDDDGPLVALVRLVHQQEPLLALRRTGPGVDPAPVGVKPCRRKDINCSEKERKKVDLVPSGSTKQTCFFFLACNVKFILLR